jgi:hypothetical protein
MAGANAANSLGNRRPRAIAADQPTAWATIFFVAALVVAFV